MANKEEEEDTMVCVCHDLTSIKSHMKYYGTVGFGRVGGLANPSHSPTSNIIRGWKKISLIPKGKLYGLNKKMRGTMWITLKYL